MKILFIIIMLLYPAILIGQISNDQNDKLPDGWIRRPVLGVLLRNDSDKTITVHTVGNNTIADSAGIKANDKILLMERDTIKNKIDLLRSLYNKQPGDYLNITVLRDGVAKSFSLRLGYRDWTIEEDAINVLLNQERNVRVAIILGKIVDNYTNYNRNEEQVQDIRRLALVREEELLLNSFSSYPNFTLIDRTQTEAVLKELKFGLTGQLSFKESAMVGKMLGANYFLFIEMTASKGNSEPIVNNIVRLIEIETGKVVASGIEEY